MRKHVMILIGLLFALLISGCGGSSSSVITISGITTEPISSSEIPATSTFYIKQKDGSTTTYTYNSLSNGNIILTNNNTQYTFTRIQTETNYWLVFDSSYTISRLYLVSPPSDYDPKMMGGSIQPVIPLTLSATATVLCGSGSTTGGYADGSSTNAQFSQPMSITFDGTYYYVADYANNMIRKIDSSGKVTTFAGNTSGTSGSGDGTGTAAYFYHPMGITTDGTYLYVADTGNHTIRKIVINTQVVSTIAGVASSAGSIDATGSSARFNSPWEITTDGANLYVADTGNYIIRKIRLSTYAVSTIAGSSGKSETVDGTYTNARFVQPTRLTMEGSNLYVVDYNGYGNSAIRKVVIATGTVSSFAGGSNTNPTTKLFGHLGGITTDGTNLYVGDGATDNQTSYIRVINIVSAQLTRTIQIGTATNITPPYGFTTDGSHLYYTSSFYNNISYY
jgi:hypothetical protein